MVKEMKEYYAGTEHYKERRQLREKIEAIRNYRIRMNIQEGQTG